MRSSVVVATIGVSFLTACGATPLRMEVNPAIAHVEAFQVHGYNPRLWKRPIVFGNWRTLTIDESSIDHASGPPQGTKNYLGAKHASQAYRFVLASERAATRNEINSECSLQKSSIVLASEHRNVKDETEVELPANSILDCEFIGRPSGGGGSMRLRTIASLTSKREEGDVEFQGSKWSVRSVNHYEGERNRFGVGRYGFELLADRQLVAAVETDGPGRVWIDPSLDPQEQDYLAVAITALMLYQPDRLDSEL